MLLSNITFVEGDLAEAARLGRRAVGIARTAPGRENLALALICSTHPALVEGDLPRAAALLDEALAPAAAPDRFAETIARYQRARLLAGGVRWRRPSRGGPLLGRREGRPGPARRGAGVGGRGGGGAGPRPRRRRRSGPEAGASPTAVPWG